MPSPVITVENLGKRYVLGHQRSKNDGMRHVVEDGIRASVRWLRSGRGPPKRQKTEFWALKGVSFQVNQGEVVGIIGRNGAGKSTLFKLLSRITVPTEGRISIEGRVASLLEVGTGFHKELTGRENIFLNGAILGMTRAEIIRKFDEIVDFSEIGKFLDTPVKHYSSGMYVRLAFAVAAHLEPEILIVDEVLAVGDTSFQKKCLGKMGNFAERGKTVLFISHNMEAVRKLCQRCVWLKDGRVQDDGGVETITQAYYDDVTRERSSSGKNQDYGLVIKNVRLKNARGEVSSQFRPGEDLVVEISYDAKKRLERPNLVLGVAGIRGTCFTANTMLDGRGPEYLTAAGKISCLFRSLPLFPQRYVVKMGIWAKNGQDIIVDYQDVAFFNVAGDLTEYGYKGEFLSRTADFTPVVIPHEWRLPDGATASVSLEARRV